MVPKWTTNFRFIWYLYIFLLLKLYKIGEVAILILLNMVWYQNGPPYIRFIRMIIERYGTKMDHKFYFLSTKTYCGPIWSLLYIPYKALYSEILKNIFCVFSSWSDLVPLYKIGNKVSTSEKSLSTLVAGGVLTFFGLP